MSSLVVGVVTTSKIGAIILRVQGDAASPNDLRILMRTIVVDPDLRRRCKSIGGLSRDIPEVERYKFAKFCLDILYSWAPPLDPNPDFWEWFEHFSHKPLHRSAWASHYWRGERGYQMSGLLEDVIRAVEDLWAVPGQIANKV